MPFGWAAAAAAVATIAGGAIQSDATDKASDAQSKSSAAAVAESARQNDLARSDSLPYRSAGKASVEKLRDLLGIGGFGNSGSSGSNVVTQNYQGTMVDSRGGVPAPNPELYAGDPGYRKAWDDVQATHDAWRASTGAPAGYNNGSDPTWIEREIRNRLPQTAPEAAPSTVAADPNQPYGDSPLTRRFTVDDFWNDPVTKLGYQFGLDEGRKGLDRSGASRGMLNSGAQLKALTRFGTDYAGTKAADSENRFRTNQDSVYNKFSNLAGLGQVSTAQTGQTGAMNAANVGNIMTAAGNARGAAAIAKGNAYGGALNTVGSYWNQQNMMNQFNNNRNGQQTPYFQYSGYDQNGGPAYG